VGRHISLRQGRGYIVTKLLRENEALRLIPILEFAMDTATIANIISLYANTNPPLSSGMLALKYVLGMTKKALGSHWGKNKEVSLLICGSPSLYRASSADSRRQGG